MDLHQRKLFTVREFSFKENGLHLKVKNLASSYEVEIPFEEINLKKIIRQKKTDSVIIIVGIFFGLIFILNFIFRIIGNSTLSWDAIIVLFVFTALSGLIAYINTKKQILLPTSNNGLLEIYDGRPSKEISEKFIFDLTSKSNIYLKNKYGKIDRDLPVEPQLANLVWLKEREILNNDEFEDLKNNLLGKRNNINPIGFR
jgi:hypothetical protein